MRIGPAVLVSLLALALAPAAASAATLGSVEGTPVSGCPAGSYECTLTMPDGSLVAPTDGIITHYRVHHGAYSGGDIPAFGLRIIGPDGSSRPVSNESRISSGEAVEQYTVNVPIKAGEQVGLYTSAPGMPLVTADGRLLVELTIAGDQEDDPYTIDPFYADVIEEFHAEQPAVYRAATIKRLPLTTNLFQAVMEGWSQPLRCSLACRITAAASMRGISGSLLAMMSRTVRVASVVAEFPTAGSGRIRVKLTEKAARALRRHGKTVKVDYRVVVTDGRRRSVRHQTLKLVARR